MKKKVLSIILCVCYLLTLVSCANKQDTGSVGKEAAVSGEEAKKLQIVTTRPKRAVSNSVWSNDTALPF